MMDIEKLIVLLQNNRHPNGLKSQAATALSTLQAENEKLRTEKVKIIGNDELMDELQAVQDENEKLRAESIMHHNAADNYWHELNEYRQERNEALAELERVKLERDTLIKRTSGECWTCIRRYECNSRRGPHRRCWEFDSMLLRED